MLFHHLSRFIVNIKHRSITYLYKPRGLLRLSNQKPPFYRSDTSLAAQIPILDRARLYTDNTCNISVIQKQLLLSGLSWQYEYGTVLDDRLNYALTHNNLFRSFPKYYKSTVVSLLTGGSGNYNYYHWLFDVLSRYFLAVDNFPSECSHAKYLVPSLAYSFQAQSLALLGITSSRCIQAIKHNHITAAKLVATSHPNPEPHTNQGWIIDRLRKSFLDISNQSIRVTNSPLIYISRADSTHRRTLSNEADLFERLETFGFAQFSLSKLTFKEQVNLFAHAKIIIGVHGAGFANLSFASEGTLVFELFSSSYQPDMYEKIAMHVGLEYHKIVCTADPEAQSPQTANAIISSSVIDAIIERIGRFVY